MRLLYTVCEPWEVSYYKILHDKDGKPLALKPIISPETVFNDVTIGNIVDQFLRGYARGLEKRGGNV